MPRPKKSESLTEAISTEIKANFNLEKFKEKKLLNGTVKFKEQKWIPFSKALQDSISVAGAPVGHITLLRGHSNTGKTTALLELAISAQKMGILPVFIITEMKWSWEHARTMGFQLNDVVDETTGEVVDHDGFFIYKDRSSLGTIEDVAEFIADLLDEQKKGNLPYDLCFFWDSIGSIPCKMSVEANKNNPMWNAGAMSQQFGNFINQRFPLSRKENAPYTNSMVAINKIWVAPAENIMAQPKMKMKNGETMFLDASIVLTFGNITNSGTSKIKATKDGKEVEFAVRTKVSCDKNHVTGLQTKSVVIATIHGFIQDDKKEIDTYKKSHSMEWKDILGDGKFEVIEDSSDWNESTRDIPLDLMDGE
jgi:hypothetical protein